jgi:hypothetical protein
MICRDAIILPAGQNCEITPAEAVSKSRHSALDAESLKTQFDYYKIAGMLNLIQCRNDALSFNTFGTASAGVTGLSRLSPNFNTR